MQRRYPVSLQPAHLPPQPTTPLPRGRGGRTANRSLCRSQPQASLSSPGRPTLWGSILFQEAPASTITQASAISDNLLEFYLVGSQPASAVVAFLKDGLPAPQPSQAGLDGLQPGKSTFGPENGSTECQQAPRGRHSRLARTNTASPSLAKLA